MHKWPNVKNNEIKINVSDSVNRMIWFDFLTVWINNRLITCLNMRWCCKSRDERIPARLSLCSQEGVMSRGRGREQSVLFCGRECVSRCCIHSLHLVSRQVLQGKKCCNCQEEEDQTSNKVRDDEKKPGKVSGAGFGWRDWPLPSPSQDSIVFWILQLLLFLRLFVGPHFSLVQVQEMMMTKKRIENCFCLKDDAWDTCVSFGSIFFFLFSSGFFMLMLKLHQLRHWMNHFGFPWISCFIHLFVWVLLSRELLLVSHFSLCILWTIFFVCHFLLLVLRLLYLFFSLSSLIDILRQENFIQEITDASIYRLL